MKSKQSLPNQTLQLIIAKQQKKYPLLKKYIVRKQHINAYEDLIGPLYQDDTQIACTVMKKNTNGFGSSHGAFLTSIAVITAYSIAMKEVEKIKQNYQKYIMLTFNTRFIAYTEIDDLIQSSGSIINEVANIIFIKGELKSKGKIILDFNAILEKRLIISKKKKKIAFTPLIKVPNKSRTALHKIFERQKKEFPLLKKYMLSSGIDSYETLIGPFSQNGSKSAFVITKKCINVFGDVHAGVFNSFVDYSIFQIKEKITRYPCVTLALKMRYLFPAKLGDLLQSDGVVTKQTKRMLFIKGQITSKKRIIVDFDAILKMMSKSKAQDLKATANL